jgi:type II secretory pathway component PulF
MKAITSAKPASSLPVIGLSAFAAALAVSSYLIFLFPKLTAVWAEQHRALSFVEQIAMNLSEFCRHFGLVLLPLLLAGIVACALWAGRGRRKMEG